MPATSLRRGATAVISTALLAAGVVLGAGTATAAGSVGPAAPDPVTASIEHLGDAVLYRSGLQVYEVAAVRAVENISPPADELVLRRVHSAGDGIPGAPRFVFVGTALPEAFVVAEAWEQPGVPYGVIVPADPVTLARLPLGDNLRMVSVLTGPLGPFAGAGMSSPYLG
ncbi:hypothetical protein [Tomitella gaofuii]|uniref:hypothetical protein n=1 Tax=Tomitella gaofuii TaxID=2760083 RepID=UPI0015FBB965|nr:hypothetical protein [Tomitella gaofuii]